MFETYKLISKLNNARKRKIHYIWPIFFYTNVNIISLIFSFILYFHTIIRFLSFVICQMSRTFPLILLSIISLDFRLRRSAIHFITRPECTFISSFLVVPSHLRLVLFFLSHYPPPLSIPTHKHPVFPTPLQLPIATLLDSLTCCWRRINRHEAGRLSCVLANS